MTKIRISPEHVIIIIIIMMTTTYPSYPETVTRTGRILRKYIRLFMIIRTRTRVLPESIPYGSA